MVAERKIYEEQGVEKYVAHQVEHENEPLKPGAAFPFVQVGPKPGPGPTRARGESTCLRCLQGVCRVWPLECVKAGCGHIRELCMTGPDPFYETCSSET